MPLLGGKGLIYYFIYVFIYLYFYIYYFSVIPTIPDILGIPSILSIPVPVPNSGIPNFPTCQKNPRVAHF